MFGSRGLPLSAVLAACCFLPSLRSTQAETSEVPERMTPLCDPKVIYGDDDRLEYYQVGPVLRCLSRSTFVLVSRSDLVSYGDRFRIDLSNTFQSLRRVCPNEPFASQPVPGFCSGFLVGPDLVVTAGHCISPHDLDRIAFVFGFQVDESGKVVSEFPVECVYYGSEILGRSLGNSDWCVVRLDRPVTGRLPLSFRTDGAVSLGQHLVVIGYPAGLPLKIADGAWVRENKQAAYFVANLDTYGGNSGSAVVNADTLLVEGLLVRGEVDFEFDTESSCFRSRKCADEGCSGEDCTRATQWAGLVIAETAPSPTPTLLPGTTPTPTSTVQEEVCDSGYYILDSFGSRHRVGYPIWITGSLYFATRLAKDMERAKCAHGVFDASGESFVVLDGFGGATFVGGAECSIPQDFYLGGQQGSFPEGRAVDVEISKDSKGLWVLTDYGGIYRAGSAKDEDEPPMVPATDRMGVLGYDVPLTEEIRAPTLPAPGGATLHAVGFAVIDENGDSRADGYVILDSMGGRFHIHPDGTPIEAAYSCGCAGNEPARILDPLGYVWPFFPGLDVARDIELHPSQAGVVILDGWDGIHPVPVDVESNPVFFANNTLPGTNGDIPAQAVGLPYVTAGFDDPETPEIENDRIAFGNDAASVFTDLEFAAGCPNGLYTLDRYGGVFVLGSARNTESDPTPDFSGSPYFFPFLYAADMEVFAYDESDLSPGPGPRTDFSLSVFSF